MGGCLDIIKIWGMVLQHLLPECMETGTKRSVNRSQGMHLIQVPLCYLLYSQVVIIFTMVYTLNSPNLKLQQELFRLQKPLYLIGGHFTIYGLSHERRVAAEHAG